MGLYTQTKDWWHGLIELYCAEHPAESGAVRSAIQPGSGMPHTTPQVSQQAGPSNEARSSRRLAGGVSQSLRLLPHDNRRQLLRPTRTTRVRTVGWLARFRHLVSGPSAQQAILRSNAGVTQYEQAHPQSVSCHCPQQPNQLIHT